MEQQHPKVWDYLVNWNKVSLSWREFDSGHLGNPVGMRWGISEGWCFILVDPLGSYWRLWIYSLKYFNSIYIYFKIVIQIWWIQRPVKALHRPHQWYRDLRLMRYHRGRDHTSFLDLALTFIQQVIFRQLLFPRSFPGLTKVSDGIQFSSVLTINHFL